LIVIDGFRYLLKQSFGSLATFIIEPTMKNQNVIGMVDNLFSRFPCFRNYHNRINLI
jgi:hypothetical protein